MNYLIGKIINTHGLKGEVVIKELTDFERFVKDKEIYLIFNHQTIDLKIKDVKQVKKGLIVSFYDYDDINKIEVFKGLDLFTNEKPPLEEDEFHVDDLIGKKVYNQHNSLVGEVIEVIEVPQGHILRVQTASKTALVPFNEIFVKEVSEVITIEEIEGLI